MQSLLNHWNRASPSVIMSTTTAQSLQWRDGPTWKLDHIMEDRCLIFSLSLTDHQILELVNLSFFIGQWPLCFSKTWNSTILIERKKKWDTVCPPFLVQLLCWGNFSSFVIFVCSMKSCGFKIGQFNSLSLTNLSGTYPCRHTLSSVWSGLENSDLCQQPNKTKPKTYFGNNFLPKYKCQEKRLVRKIVFGRVTWTVIHLQCIGSLSGRYSAVKNSSFCMCISNCFWSLNKI